MRRKYIMAGAMLYLSLLAGTASANSSALVEETENSTEVWQVPHKPKGTKTRLKIQPKAEQPAAKKADKQKPQAKKSDKKSVKKVSSSLRYVAIKTNAVYWAGAIANIAAEVKLHKHVSLELPLDFSLWDIEREHGVRLVLFQPEARWWMKGVGEGHFVGVHAHVGAFNVKWNEDRYQVAGRPLLGAGLTYGYSLSFDEHWGAEFLIGAGYANMKYDRFYNIDNGAKFDAGTYNYWGVTRVGASLVYRF